MINSLRRKAFSTFQEDFQHFYHVKKAADWMMIKRPIYKVSIKLEH